MAGKCVLKAENFKIEFNKSDTKSDTETEFGSFEIKEGDFVLLKGRNGSGKSTLLKMINLNFGGAKAYCKVTGGSITYFDKKGDAIVTTSAKELKEFETLRRGITEVKQDESFASTMTPYEALYHASEMAIRRDETMSNDDKSKALKELDELINKLYDGYPLINGVELELSQVLNNCSKREFRRKKLTAFSGGQQKMIQVIAGFVKAKITKTNLMILDEPANNLDGKNKYYLNLLFKELHASKDMAILMISHCHVFDDISMIIDIDDAKNGFKGKVIHKETAADKSIFEPHHDCIEDCGLRSLRRS